MARALRAFLGSAGCILSVAQQVSIPEWDEVTTQDENVSAVEKMNVLEASSWAVPGRVARCPVHLPPTINIVDNTVQMDTTFNESTMYSIVEGTLPSAAVNHGLSGYDGLEIAFSNTKVRHFKVRLNDTRQDARFIAAVRVLSDGPHNLWLKWSDFHGEELVMQGIRPCAETATCFTITPSSISHIAILLPIEDAEAPAKFTVERMTLDVLARGGANDTNSATIRPSSDAEEIRFETTTIAGSNQMMVSSAFGGKLALGAILTTLGLAVW